MEGLHQDTGMHDSTAVLMLETEVCFSPGWPFLGPDDGDSARVRTGPVDTGRRTESPVYFAMGVGRPCSSSATNFSFASVTLIFEWLRSRCAQASTWISIEVLPMPTTSV